MPRPKLVHFDPAIHPNVIRQGIGFGLTEEQVAYLIGVSPSTLSRWKSRRAIVSNAIKEGVPSATNQVARSLFMQATGAPIRVECKCPQCAYEFIKNVPVPKNVIAAIFWLKARAGWTETSRMEVTERSVIDILRDGNRKEDQPKTVTGKS